MPFGRFPNLHVARFVVVEDATLSDLPTYGVPVPSLPIYLVFLGDCDGPASAMLDALVAEAGPGLRRIFAFCSNFGEGTDLGTWMRAHSVRSTTEYTNWMGRTVQQIREEAAAYKDRVVKEAEGEAARFLSIYEQYKAAPDVTRKRLFLETMEGVMKNSKKVITDSNGNQNSVVPLLPLNQLSQPAQKETQK